MNIYVDLCIEKRVMFTMPSNTARAHTISAVNVTLTPSSVTFVKLSSRNRLALMVSKARMTLETWVKVHTNTELTPQAS